MRTEAITRRRALLTLSACAAPAWLGGAAARDREGPEGSMYSLEFSVPPTELVGDLLETERGDPRLQSEVPHREWYSREVERRFGAWGPPARHYPTPPGLGRRPTAWLRERAVAVAARFIGYGYQHHHIPDWDPPARWPWKETCVGRNGKGVDCSNFTSFVYNQGFGIHFTSDVAKQAEAGVATVGRARPMAVRRVELPEAYDARVETLRAGDLLYIRGRPGGPITHVVLWVGQVGRSPSGVPLVLDSHGAGVDDDAGRPIPCGIQLRPFRPRSWYARCASHAHRFFHESEG